MQAAASAPAFRPATSPKRPVTCFFAVHKSSPKWPSTTMSEAKAGSSWFAWTTPTPPPPHTRVVEVALSLPLSPDETVELEHRLQAALGLPPYLTVFAIVRSDEQLTAPPVPLVLLHGLVDAAESRCGISVLIRPFIQANPGALVMPPPSAPLPVAALARGDASAGAELLHRLRRDGVARLVADEPLAARLAACYSQMPAFFDQPESAKASFYQKLRPSPQCKQYAGVGCDSGREWLQIRRWQRTGRGVNGRGTNDFAAAIHGAPACVPEGLPATFAATFDELRAAAGHCLSALAVGLDIDPAPWLALTDLSEEFPRSEALCEDRCGGPSVLRLYRYRPASEGGCGCHAHADLGLLTLSPAPTTPGLCVYDVETLTWRDSELGLGDAEITIFAGEQLALLSGGRIPAPIHRVPPTSSDAHTRYSMPFFARARPDAMLVPLTEAGSGPARQTMAPLPRPCEDFVLEQLFRRRPWRPNLANDGSTPDY